MTSRFLSLLLVLCLWPATGEMVEYAVHWAEFGDTAHGTGDTHGETPLGADEHGCSGMFHICSCHTGAQVVAPQLASVVISLSSDPSAPAAPPSDRLGCGDPPPPIRPPIA